MWSENERIYSVGQLRIQYGSSGGFALLAVSGHRLSGSVNNRSQQWASRPSRNMTFASLVLVVVVDQVEGMWLSQGLDLDFKLGPQVG